jgi:DNA-binding MarR family transcriptional regulator
MPLSRQCVSFDCAPRAGIPSQARCIFPSQAKRRVGGGKAGYRRTIATNPVPTNRNRLPAAFNNNDRRIGQSRIPLSKNLSALNDLGAHFFIAVCSSVLGPPGALEELPGPRTNLNHNSHSSRASRSHLSAHGRKRATAAAPRSVALELMLQSGGRLNNRAVSVLTVIAAEPGLSNTEIAESVGISGKSHISKLLARLAQRGVVENTVDAALPFEANAWQLTASGIELESAIRGDGRPAATSTSHTARRPATTKEKR